MKEKEVKKGGGNMQTSISINEYRVNCRKNEDDNAQVKANEGNSKYTVIDGITIKDIFKYEARFSASDEFDELW